MGVYRHPTPTKHAPIVVTPSTCLTGGRRPHPLITLGQYNICVQAVKCKIIFSPTHEIWPGACNNGSSMASLNWSEPSDRYEGHRWGATQASNPASHFLINMCTYYYPKPPLHTRSATRGDILRHPRSKSM